MREKPGPKPKWTRAMLEEVMDRFLKEPERHQKDILADEAKRLGLYLDTSHFRKLVKKYALLPRLEKIREDRGQVVLKLENGRRCGPSRRLVERRPDILEMILDVFQETASLSGACAAARERFDCGITPAAVMKMVNPDREEYDPVFAERFHERDANRIVRIEDKNMQVALGEDPLSAKHFGAASRLVLQAKHPAYRRESTIHHVSGPAGPLLISPTEKAAIGGIGVAIFREPREVKQLGEAKVVDAK